MKKKIIAIVLFLLLIFTGIGCAPAKESGSFSDNEQRLDIFKSDLKLTQDQVMSQIKSQHLKENKGYLDSDEVIAILKLNDDALIETYNEAFSDSVKSVAKYADSVSGQAQEHRIEYEQERLIEKLYNKQLITSVEHTYSTIINAIAVKTRYGRLDKIEKLHEVDNVILADTYNKPKDIKGVEGGTVENVVDVYETGIFNSSSVSYTGNGTAVAVLDSGFDCSHSVFSHMPEIPLWNENDIMKVLDKTNAKKTTKDLEISDVYYSDKIPYAYDYADKDPDVFPYDSEHGTHVSGIIGGKDDVITGVAINTQLVLMKVFPDLNEGADTDDILAALEDAVLLGVDAINMSLGSSCGFARAEDGSAINRVYDLINDSGISLLCAASNSYSSSFGGAQGNTNMVTNPDSATVGSPSTYPAALSVASISGTKSRYIKANGTQTFFFKESNKITGKPNDFVKELGINPGETKEFEYVTIPGAGLKVNYATVGDLTGKIALVRRGSNTFEEKAQIAKNHGAAACIIYNNIDGDIMMSMGKSDHIPTISISKDDGTILAMRDRGKMTISYDFQAGPFMSDFSSWGPTPDLHLKPEITAHGGNIKSAIPGGGYDEMSGTSMATPNLCGIVVLIRQYVKENFPSLNAKEVTILVNQLLMSTATIAKNEEGNPYSPRKQGAGLASLKNAVNTKAYITVDGSDRSKIELFDDPKRTGVYSLKFNIVNLDNNPLTYDLSVVGMTESVSTSDEKHVAETATILNGASSYKVVKGGTLDGTKVTVNAGKTASVEITYKLSKADIKYLTKSFPYGMFVEGFVKLENLTNGDDIDLNVPFLAFFGDWTEAPMFDKTYYEVEKEAHNGAIDDEDKLKADYYATTPYGSYFNNFIIPLGTYLYDIDEEKYDPIPAIEDHIALSNVFGSIDGISAVYAGLLRNAKTMHFTIKDKLTGEIVFDHVKENATKAYSYGGGPVPNFENLKFKSFDAKLVNNRQYEFKMEGLLDYKDGGVNTNMRNSFEFDFYMDEEAPVIKKVTYDKEYDKSLKKDRYYINMTIYDNHYVQSITPIIFTSQKSYTFLTENPIPVYSEKGKDNLVRFEITDFLEDIGTDAIIPNGLAFSVDDYALNSNIYVCQLPGTKGDFKFTKDGTPEGTDLTILSVNKDEVVDLTEYLSTKDKNVDPDKDYLKYLTWTSSNEKVAKIEEGQVIGLAEGRATITVKERMDGKQAVLIIDVKDPNKKANIEKQNRRMYTTKRNETVDDAVLEDLRFSYFDVIYAHRRGADTKAPLGRIGDRVYLSGTPSINCYPGEEIKLHYDMDPWYVADKYKLTYKSTNPTVAEIDQDGHIRALKKGNTSIVLSAEGSHILAKVRISVNSEFVVDDTRTLVAYKGLGGDVVIPDDEGIIYIGAYAFCLFDVDNNIVNTEEDFDKNKIPLSNNTVTSVVVPKGVDEIRKYAFYNCTALESVTLPEDTKLIREFAFTNDAKLHTINLGAIQTVGEQSFKGCASLKEVDTTHMYSIGVKAFEGCTSLTKMDLTHLRNTGKEAFKNCTNLTEVKMNENTKLSYGMFVNSGLTAIDIYEKIEIPAFCFAKCENLKTVNIHNDMVSIAKGAFSDCKSLTDVKIMGKLDVIGEQAFYQCTALTKFTLPNNDVTLGNYCFYKCGNLTTLEFQANSSISNVQGSVFMDTNLSEFVVDANNQYYTSNKELLVSKDGKTIILAATGYDFLDFILDSKYEKIANGAFSGTKINSITFNNKDLVIDDYAFANCVNLTTVTFPTLSGITVGKHVFNGCTNLNTLNNLDKVNVIGDYAFANIPVQNITIGENITVGEGAFFKTGVKELTIGANANLGIGAFQNCLSLTTVNMPANGGVHIGFGCFANDAFLATIDLSKTDKVIEAEAFYGCRSLKQANLANVVEVGNFAFADCSNLFSVKLPKIEIIGNGAFGKYDTSKKAPGFNELVLPDSLREIGEGAFLGCEGLSEIVIPSGVSKINNFAFAYCLNLEKVTLPGTISNLGDYAFAGCANLRNINLDNIETISQYAFAGTEKLKTVNLANALTIGEGAFSKSGLNSNLDLSKLEEVGKYAFQNTYILSINAPKLKRINEGAFQNVYGLNEFIFSNELEFIGQIAFNGCSRLTSFYFMDGDKKTNTGKINDYATLDNGVLYTTLNHVHMELKSVPQANPIPKLVVLEGTYAIDFFAGNQNTFITEIVLPDTLKSIGGYAFFGYKNLAKVEFKSVIAPALEDNYNRNAKLNPEDPGFEILHNAFDMFGQELCYYNFIDLVGKKQPIKMVLPKNKDIKGYDSIVYLVYFGEVEKAERSDYVAMETAIFDFMQYSGKLSLVDVITLGDEKLVNNAIRALNLVKQDPTNYGIEKALWDERVEIVNNAKHKIFLIKLNQAKQEIQDLQARIDVLDTNFDITKLESLKQLSLDINALKFEEKSLLDLTKYNELVSSYNIYLEKINTEAKQTVSVINNTLLCVSLSVTATMSLAGIALAIIKRKMF